MNTKIIAQSPDKKQRLVMQYDSRHGSLKLTHEKLSKDALGEDTWNYSSSWSAGEDCSATGELLELLNTLPDQRKPT